MRFVLFFSVEQLINYSTNRCSPRLDIALKLYLCPPQYDLAPAPMPPPFPPDHPPLPQEDMELSSEPESEYDSGDDDENKER